MSSMPRLDYGSTTFAGIPTYMLDWLQSVLNAAARLMIHGRRKFDRVTPLLQELHWLSATERIKFRLAVLSFSAAVAVTSGRVPGKRPALGH